MVDSLLKVPMAPLTAVSSWLPRETSCAATKGSQYPKDRVRTLWSAQMRTRALKQVPSRGWW